MEPRERRTEAPLAAEYPENFGLGCCDPAVQLVAGPLAAEEGDCVAAKQAELDVVLGENLPQDNGHIGKVLVCDHLAWLVVCVVILCLTMGEVKDTVDCLNCIFRRPHT